MGRAASVRDHCGILRVGLAPPGWRSAVRRSASKAGICSGTPAVLRSLEWPGSRRVLRVLAEITETAPREALSAAAGLLGGLAPAAAQVLLHGEDTAAWPVLRARGLPPPGCPYPPGRRAPSPRRGPAPGNAALVRAAREIIQQAPPGTR